MRTYTAFPPLPASFPDGLKQAAPLTPLLVPLPFEQGSTKTTASGTSSYQRNLTGLTSELPERLSASETLICSLTSECKSQVVLELTEIDLEDAIFF